MLTSLSMKGYRAFKNLEIEDLGRVNLFVGRNNCGKTSILEASEILLGGTDPAIVIRSTIRRGEIISSRTQERVERKFDLSHLFHGHKIDTGEGFQVFGDERDQCISISCQVSNEASEGESKDKLLFKNGDAEAISFLVIKHSMANEVVRCPLSSPGAISHDWLRRLRFIEKKREKNVNFIGADALDGEEMGELWNSIALTNEEESVLEALRILEPEIDRIAFLSGSSYRLTRSSEGIFAKLRGLEERIPLGSLGDGIRHLLSISLAVIRSSGGAVMIDEIDTGLHFSVMTDMWRVLIKTADRLDVQVFATTHSLDCLRSLAWLNEHEPKLCEKVRLHRVEIERERTTVYSPDEIMEAAKHHMEIRG